MVELGSGVAAQGPELLVGSMAPRGREPRVDGHRLLGAAIEFSRELRAAGLAIDLGAVVDFARSLELVDVGRRSDVHAAGAAVFVRHPEERAVYDRVFGRFWRARGGPGRRLEPPTAILDDRESVTERAGEEARRDLDGSEGGGGSSGDRREQDQGSDQFDGIVISARAYSHEGADRHRQFDRMTPAELREAERFIDLLTPNLELRRTRRKALDRRGPQVAPRTMFRRNLKTGGQPIEWVWQRPVRRPRSLLVLCDISGSMERHSRLLLRFTQALAASAVRTEAFVFGTRLTRVTRLLRGRDRNRALARVAEATTDWSGGTRIGDCLHDFNQRWARRTLRSSAVVVIVSDGWDLGDPALVGRETARLRRSCHRLIWLNPLASAPGYAPLAGGMAAALPHVDDFVPAGNLASLERLAALLSDTTARRTVARMDAPNGRPAAGAS